jgi:hypothetical protein
MSIDLFRADYSPERRGDLLDYLRESDEGSFDNCFIGPEYFFVIKEKGLIVPNLTSVRVNMSPAPDLFYLINDEFLLQSNGGGEYNMSCIDAPRGIYDPSKILVRKAWSIYHLNPEVLFKTN